MSAANAEILIVMAAYLVGMIAVGLMYSRKNTNVNEFYLGGRRLGPLVTAMSAEASDMSGWLLMGLPGVAYFTGLADAAWTAIGLAVGTYLNWLLVAKRLRRYSEKAGNAITIPNFFANRYRDKGNMLLIIPALVIVVFFIPYVGSGFAACGKLFASLLGVDYHGAMIVSGLVIVAYTLLGGFLAVSTTDLIQSVVMTVALIVVVVFGIHQAGGVSQVAETARSVPGYLSLIQLGDISTRQAASYGPITILSTLAWGLGYFGMPHILLRFMAVREEKQLTLSRRIASVWVVIAMGVAIFIGIVGFGMSGAGAIETFATSSAAESVIVKIAQLLSSFGFFPAAVAGLILAGILASTMSTADSQLLAAASSVSQNLLRDAGKMKFSDKTAILIARVTVVCIALVGMVIAWNPDSNVFRIVSFAWAGFGAAFGPVMLFSLFWKRANKQGALAGMIAGGVMIFVWKFLVRPLGGAWNIYELLPAFLVACAAILIVSLATPAPSKEIVEEFESV